MKGILKSLMQRRRFSLLLAVALMSSGTVVVASGSLASATAVKFAGTITIGDIAPFTGSTAASGIDGLAGAQIALDGINKSGGVTIKKGKKVLHYKLAVKSLNETGVATDSINGLRSFASSGIKLQMGFALTGDCNAVGPVAQQLGVLTMATCTGDQFRSAADFPNWYSISTDNQDQTSALTKLMVKLNPTEIDALAYDYAQGHASWGLITAKANDAGLKYTSPIVDFVPTSATDFSTQVSSMASSLSSNSKGRVLALLTYGSGNTLFIKAAAQYGITSLFQGIFTTGEWALAAQAMAGSAPLVWNSYDYCNWQAWNNPVNNAFAAAYHKKTGSYPIDWSEQGFTEIQTIAQAITAANSFAAPAVMKAMKTLKVKNTPIGSFTFNPSTHEANVQLTSCQTVGSPSSPSGVKLIQYFKTVVSGS